MPDQDTTDRRQPQWLPRVSVWGGVGLAGLAGLLLLIGGPGQRIGGLLGMLAVIAIGVSIALRPEPSSAAATPVEARLYEEIDALRAELRAEIEHAVRSGYYPLEERLAGLSRQVEMVRAEVAAPAGPSRPVSAVAGAAAVAAAAVPMPVEPPVRGRVEGPAEPPMGRSAPPRPEVTQAPRPVTGGVYRHTETVRVTHSTYVDTGTFPQPTGLDHDYPEQPWPEPSRAAAEAPADRWQDRPEERYPGGRSGHRGARYPDPQHPRDRHRNDDQYPDDRYPDQYPDDRYPDRYSDDRGRYDPDGWSDQRWGRDDAGPPELRTGQRWASVRTSGDGRELRMGERRVARHRDEHGDEVRVEDRWAAVQQSDRGRGRSRHAEPVEPEQRARPALPPGDGGTWSEGWAGATTNTGRGRRYREPEEEPYRPQQLDFEPTDQRWR